MKDKQKRRLFLGGLAIISIIAFFFAVGMGAVYYSPLEIFSALLHYLGLPFPKPPSKLVAIIFMVRLPRVLSAYLVGASLATAGCAMQGLFRNPLASPNILGISAGGSLGAVIAIQSGIFALHFLVLPGMTIFFAGIAALLIYLLATRQGSTSLLYIILAGMAISSFLGGMISLVLLLSNEYEISRYVFWTMGGLDGRRWEHVLMVLPFMATGITALIFLSRELNINMLGDDSSHSLGVNVQFVKKLSLGISAMLTGVAVSISGTIGFVGLLVPHLLRLLMGGDHRYLLPASAIGGGLFLMVCDLLGRVLLAPFEIRVGIITALIGAPYLVFLILRAQRRSREK